MNPGDLPTQTSDPAEAQVDATEQQQAAVAQKAGQTLDEVREAHAQVRRLIEVIEADGRYPLEAFRFLQEGLDHAVKMAHGAEAGIKKRRRRRRKGAEAEADDLRQHPHHVDGRQLCLGLRDLAEKRWGRMATAVLRGWNVRQTLDFGEMVFVLVENRFLQKTDRDRREDFADVYAIGDLERDYAIGG